MGDELVSLYRCKICGARMFESHTASHLSRHRTVEGSALPYFERGPRDTHPRPGGQAVTYGRARLGKGGRRVGQVMVTPPDDELVATEDEPLVSLEEIVGK
jgi:hypothetical protein